MRSLPHLESAEPWKFLENLDAAAYSLECAEEIALGGLCEEKISAGFRAGKQEVGILLETDTDIEVEGMRWMHAHGRQIRSEATDRGRSQ